MKTLTKTLIMTVAALTTLSAAALASPGATHGVGKATAKAAVLVCPVTGNKIASAKAAVGHETYKGKTYFFCCPECQPRFDKNRAGIAANAAKGKYEKM